MDQHVSLSSAAVGGFDEALRQHGLAPLRRDVLSELQVNVGRLCNQACHHCHVDAGPNRTEIMSWATMENILAWARTAGVNHADLTGGAPELNPHFRQFVDALLTAGIAVTSRCNLTVLLEPDQEDLAAWYAQRCVRLVCSLPCYTRENVDRQRGKGVFAKSIRALQQLNRLGYGTREDRVLDLVYNPGGAFLPAAQDKLEADYRTRLREDFTIEFSNLLTITNLPINRFRHALQRDGELKAYERLLWDSFNPLTVPGLMCRHLISVDWLGRVFDCDFNQMLDLPLAGGAQRYLWDIDASALKDGVIAVGRHCLGCTAGTGSSCGGALA